MENSFTIPCPDEKMIPLGNTKPLVFILGPCAIESREHALESAHALQELAQACGITFIYKSSFDKANRSSSTSFRGLGMHEGLAVLDEIRERFRLPVVTDIHTPEQAAPVAEVVDMLQTPAFLCRQTDLIVAAAATGKPVNIKKGQFLAPWEMANVVSKAVATGNKKISLCERGTSFGYGNLVVDMRSFPIMAATGHPVVFDATHSVQLPGALGSASGGQREFVAPLARAAISVGIAALFMEVHPDPDKALCDGPNMLSFTALSHLLPELLALDHIVKNKDVPNK